MDYYKEIREEFLRNNIKRRVDNYVRNKNDLMTYYNVGKLLVEAQGGEVRAKYGDGLIKEYSKRLTEEFGRGYSVMNLKYMRKFFLYVEKGQTMSVRLSWSHYVELIKLKDINEINYYIDICIKNNIDVRTLRSKIKNQEYQRLDDNTKNKLIKHEDIVVSDFIKNPILIKNIFDYDDISEFMLKELILRDMANFLKELGDVFCYIENEYKIKLGDRYNFIDLLLFNIDYNCYVVIELKVIELKKEHIGQIHVYMNYIDNNLRKEGQDRTIGIIICRCDNMFIMQYCSDERIYRTTYVLN